MAFRERWETKSVARRYLPLPGCCFNYKLRKSRDANWSSRAFWAFRNAHVADVASVRPCEMRYRTPKGLFRGRK